VAATIPWTITSVYQSEARVRQMCGATIAITVALNVFMLGPTLVMVTDDGSEGAARAFLYGNFARALLAHGAHTTGRLGYGPLLDPDELDPGDAITMAPLA